MANKKVSRLSPMISIKTSGLMYEDLDYGDCFIMDGSLWIKTWAGTQQAVNLETGEYEDELRDCYVKPVDIKITWKERK